MWLIPKGKSLRVTTQIALLAPGSKAESLYFKGFESSAKKPPRYRTSPRITFHAGKRGAVGSSATDSDRASASGVFRSDRASPHSVEHLDLARPSQHAVA
jgi:hypothetical protein